MILSHAGLFSNSPSLLPRSRALTFLEFLEALGRLSDLICPPPPEEMVETGCLSMLTSAEYYARGLDQVCHMRRQLPKLSAHRMHKHRSTANCQPSTPPSQGTYLPDRPSAEIMAPKTRPLADKIDQILEVIIFNLKEFFGAR